MLIRIIQVVAFFIYSNCASAKLEFVDSCENTYFVLFNLQISKAGKLENISLVQVTDFGQSKTKYSPTKAYISGSAEILEAYDWGESETGKERRFFCTVCPTKPDEPYCPAYYEQQS